MVICGLYYASDQPLEALKAKWTYDNSQFVTIDETPVHYRINGSGETLVLLHGTGASLHTWAVWTDTLAKDFRVISLDLPAYGLTGPHRGGKYTLDFYAQFLDKFLQRIGVEQFSLAGNSLGGGIAWRYASLFPDKVNKLILIDAVAYPQAKEPPLVFRLAKNKLLSKLLLKISPKFLFEKSMKEVYYQDDLVDDALIDRYYELYLRKGNRQAFIDRIRTMQAADTTLLQNIQIPSLIMWGKHDEWVRLENAYKFERDLPQAELIVYEKAGHVPMEEIPILSAQDARSFLQRKTKLAAEQEE